LPKTLPPWSSDFFWIRENGEWVKRKRGESRMGKKKKKKRISRRMRERERERERERDAD
jgi:hypothetical protein